MIFIIRREFEVEFKEKITSKYARKIQVGFVFQELNDLPNGFIIPKGREKPWGTGHAILSASNVIHEPFCVINADDYYGRESFKKLADFYSTENHTFCMVAFRLERTLSPFGGVTRGICKVENKRLINVVETGNIRKIKREVISDRDVRLDGSEPVSANMWGFTPILFNYLRQMFVDFLKERGAELKSEFLIPTVINDLVQSDREVVEVLRSSSNWFGVTFKEDKAFVVGEIKKLIDQGVYPKGLFED